VGSSLGHSPTDDRKRATESALKRYSLERVRETADGDDKACAIDLRRTFGDPVAEPVD
jgi:hypothetical protein